ncbi:hypothetical protein HOLleu_30414 [Holothuria leucospilota]|uniref:Uncharacterized protein n=1 Tax=Holothuria leucospilota TaxID=206669 RepID=A0A9Q1BKD0_HOLLE|nr:hypothetical protein HOLleu_30414 [Holothuria leucospilota]
MYLTQFHRTPINKEANKSTPCRRRLRDCPVPGCPTNRLKRVHGHLATIHRLNVPSSSLGTLKTRIPRGRKMKMTEQRRQWSKIHLISQVLVIKKHDLRRVEMSWLFTKKSR